jgi:hypothetical protein
VSPVGVLFVFRVDLRPKLIVRNAAHLVDSPTCLVKEFHQPLAVRHSQSKVVVIVISD